MSGNLYVGTVIGRPRDVSPVNAATIAGLVPAPFFHELGDSIPERVENGHALCLISCCQNRTGRLFWSRLVVELECLYLCREAPVVRMFIDADAMPTAIREILFRASERTATALVIVANVPIKHPVSPLISDVVVPPGLDEADDAIVSMVGSGDIVITADIPLAARAVEQGAVAIDPRGNVFSRENIQERLVMRNLMEELRAGGIETGGPSRFSARDTREFAGSLDRVLSRGKAAQR